MAEVMKDLTLLLQHVAITSVPNVVVNLHCRPYSIVAMEVPCDCRAQF